MKVKDFLTRERWVNHPGDRVNTFCLLEAIKYCYGTDGFNKILNRVQYELRKNQGLCFVQHWNDKKERKYEEVISLCERLDI